MGLASQCKNSATLMEMKPKRFSLGLKRAKNLKRGRGRPNLTWEESVKRDLKIGVSPKN